MFVEFNPLAVLCFVAAGIYVLRVSKRLFGSYASPAGIYGGLWCFSLAFFYLGITNFYPLGLKTILVFICSTAMFLLGTIAAKGRVSNKRAMRCQALAENLAGSDQLNILVYVLFVVGVVGSLAYYARLNQLIGIESLWLNPTRVRFEESVGELRRMGWIALAHSLLMPSFVLAVMSLSLPKCNSKRVLWAMAIVSFLFMALNSGRSTIISLIIWAILAKTYLAVSMRQRTSMIFYAAVLLVIPSLTVLYFLATSNFLDKAVDGKAGIADISLYAVSSFPAFQEMVKSPEAFDQHTSLTFGVVSRILNEINPDRFPYPDYVQPFVNVPESTNIYTYLDAFFLDFGWLGVFLCPLVIGLLTTRLYLSMRRAPSVIKVYLTSLVGLCIVGSVGVNRFGNFGIWVFVLAVVLGHNLVALFVRNWSGVRRLAKGAITEVILSSESFASVKRR